MIPPPRIPSLVGVATPDDLNGFIFWMDEIGDQWSDAMAELTAAFNGSREAAKAEVSFAYVVRNDDLLGRNGPTQAMVAAGLVSAARTAALEGVSRRWTANVIAYDSGVEAAAIMERARFMLDNATTTGEVIHLGPGHIGKALV